MKYFPFFRGKQNELLALRDLAAKIVTHGRVIPILEPVNQNSTTQKSIEVFMEKSMSFLFICNPIHGNHSNNFKELNEMIVNLGLFDYDHWIPTLYVKANTALSELDTFIKKYSNCKLALIYYGLPQDSTVRSRICDANIVHHVFVNGRIEKSYLKSIPVDNQIKVVDPFHRQTRNADYPTVEFFTDLNTISGNPNKMNFGDFSIVGNYYTEGGGAAHAVALHHVHFAKNSRTLMISHFISDRKKTPVDTTGKIIEAVNHLVKALVNLHPNDNNACEEYRQMRKSQQSSSLGYMKRLAIKHHLEVILHKDGLQI